MYYFSTSVQNTREKVIYVWRAEDNNNYRDNK
jgi:hypothetical protein